MNPDRLERARQAIAAENLDAFLVSSRENVRWLTGFSGSSGMALLTAAEVFLFTDGRYTLQAMEETSDVIVRISTDPPVKQAAEVIAETGAGVAGFESDILTVAQHTALAERAGADRLRGAEGLLSRLRAIKDADEIALIRRAAAITDQAFAHIVERIVPGASERALARELAFVLSECGAESESFPAIIAAGARSALPHAKPSDAAVAAGEMVLLDFGAQFGGYAADITRTLVSGQPSDRFREVYQIVLDAQLTGIAAIRPGVAGRDVDAAARRVIASAGYGASFGHGLGHQLGLSVHDGPGLSTTSPIVLEEGMVVTVEPGIYLEGWGGVRIEDDVLVTRDGCEVLTHAPKTLSSFPA